MSENRQIQNSVTTRRNVRCTESITTLNATPVVMYSIPLAQNRGSFVQAQCIAMRSDFGASQSMFVQAGFRRPSGGDVTRATPVNSKGFEASSGDFTGAAPSLELAANTGTQTIDVVVTGKAATTVKWYLVLLSIQNLS